MLIDSLLKIFNIGVIIMEKTFNIVTYSIIK